MRLKSAVFTISLLVLLFMSLYLRPIHADNGGSIDILNLSAQPSTIKVGDNFTINATIVNNTPNPIALHNDCLSPFSVIFDSHARVDVNEVCRWAAIQKILQPGQNITETGPGANLDYSAVSAGPANATVTVSYAVLNQTGQNMTSTGEPITISKSLQFTISNQTKATTFPAFYGKGIIVPNNVFAGTVIWTSIHNDKGLVIVQTPAGRSITHFMASLSNTCASSTICYFTTVVDSSGQAFKVGDTARFSIDRTNNQEQASVLTGLLAGVDVTVNLSKIRTTG